MALSQIALQHLRTPVATKLPDGLKPGQIAFNLANKWLMVGCTGDDVLVHGKAVAAGAATIYGVTNVVVPAKVATARPATGAAAGSMYQGEGFEVFDLKGEGLNSGTTLPNAANAAKGDLFVVVPVSGAPQLFLHNGTNWVPPVSGPAVFSATQADITSAAGADITAKAVAALAAKGGSGVTTKADLRSGDVLVVAGPGADAGSYIYDGSSFIKTGGSLPDAAAPAAGAAGATATKGVVVLARDTDITETGDALATTNNETGVVTAKQLRALADQIAGLVTGSTLLGTYDASTSGVASLTAAASAGGRGGLTVAGKLSAGTALKEGDFFVVSQAGTATGDAAPINVVLAANDHIVYVGGATPWHVISSGLIATPLSLHGCGDVSDSAVSVVAPADAKGVLVRDSSVAADGAANAYKLVNVIDLGEF
jgi:hypothetical protein